VDVTSLQSARAMVQAVVGRFGRVDVLVNNAGWDKVEPFINNTEDTWDKVLAINLRGQVNCARAALDDMMARQRGRIINIASDAGRVGSSGECVYGAAKGGVIAFTKGLAREVARYKITVNCVCPGPTDTPLFAQVAAGNPKLAEALQKAIPFRRLARPEDIANAVVFFALDASEYITGQTLSVSGGLTMA
jgi:2-hydroxycyclohexanecarboxyl-CoA dehydrogenase